MQAGPSFLGSIDVKHEIRNKNLFQALFCGN